MRSQSLYKCTYMVTPLASIPLSAPTPTLAPAQLLPLEILIDIYRHLRNTTRTLVVRQSVAAPFPKVCRAFRQAYQLARVTEVSLRGRTRIESFLEVGYFTIKDAQGVEVTCTQQDIDLVGEVLVALQGEVQVLELSYVDIGSRWLGTGMGASRLGGHIDERRLHHPTGPLLRGLMLCTRLEKVTLRAPKDLWLFTAEQMERYDQVPAT